MARPRLTLTALIERCVFVPRLHARLLDEDDSIFEVDLPQDDPRAETFAYVRDMVLRYREEDASDAESVQTRRFIAEAVSDLIERDDPTGYVFLFGGYLPPALWRHEDGSMTVCRCRECVDTMLRQRPVVLAWRAVMPGLDKVHGHVPQVRQAVAA